MKKHFLTLALILAAVIMQAGDMTWSKYNLNFWVPDGGMILSNTPTYFDKRWDEMELTIQLYTKDPKSRKEIYTTTLLRKAEGFSMYDVKKTKVKVKQYESYGVEGIMPDGTRCLLVNLVSKKSNLVVQIIINYLFGNREMAEDIVKSFAENPDRQPNHEKIKQKVKSPGHASKYKEKKKSKKEIEAEREAQRERELLRKRATGEIRDI